MPKIKHSLIKEFFNILNYTSVVNNIIPQKCILKEVNI